MRALYEIGDRVEVREAAGEPWRDGIVTDMRPGTFWAEVNGVTLEIGRRNTWPKHRPSAKSAPKVRLMRPPPPIAEPEEGPTAAEIMSKPAWDRPFLPQPKPQEAGRSLEYLGYVRTQSCMVRGYDCSGGIHAHHAAPAGHGTMGGKCSDFLAVPLCDHHHLGHWHQKGHLPGMTHDESMFRFGAEQHRLLRAWFDRMDDEEQRDALVAFFDQRAKTP
jgi:hypothetical protein